MAVRSIISILGDRLFDPKEQHGSAPFTIKARWNSENRECEYKLYDVLTDGIIVAPLGDDFKPFMAPLTSFDTIRIIEEGAA